MSLMIFSMLSKDFGITTYLSWKNPPFHKGLETEHVVLYIADHIEVASANCRSLIVLRVDPSWTRDYDWYRWRALQQ